MLDKVNLADKLDSVTAYFSPKIVGALNDLKLEVVKIKGEFVWHTHPDTDDFFLVLDGRLTIQVARPRHRSSARVSCSSFRAGSSTARRPTRRRMSS